ncbi:Vegetative incompatibility protein HET-E-1 [Psilocybe cubensis]|uniref:Vegetative incompatibility protein HET-E-1 n=2 Tax=Psilocybe cubensis TaxID=181762 RepID=A0ACB8H0N2_PSICU|nr:Vegetative incompatibility protein HET-E-1 [Psilocybe cubensis]KAH9480814.1 Vegetative incompatibility protein HET-E-1 [Psilocybe cubensis]
MDRLGLLVDITVHRAIQLPDLKTWGGDNRKFYATVIHSNQKKETKAIRSDGTTVEWNQKFASLSVHLPAQISLSIYAKHRIHADLLIGSIDVTLEAATEASFQIITPGHSELAPIIILTIDVNGTGRPTAHMDVSSSSHSSVTKSTESSPELSMQRAPEDDTLVHARNALNSADEAVEGMEVFREWTETVENVQWIMDVMQDVAGIHPYAKAAWVMISAIPQTFLEQFERDHNIETLVKTMRETFDLTQAEDILKTINPNSHQALILKVMLKHILICNEIIQRYAKDTDFYARLLKNITGKISEEIQRLCNTLMKLRRDLLDNTVINMQIAVHMIQKSMTILSNELTNLDFEIKLNDLPYKSGWNSTANKDGCLEGTRADLLEYILEWIKNPESVQGLILFGKAGTGKSSIAFEIASRFCFEEYPGSYFIFTRAQKSTQKDYHLFTTIIRDMSDHYRSFKRALGELIINNTPLRTSDDFNQLFNTLLLEPLEAVGATNDPYLIVIDGLDESADPEKLAAFLSRSLQRLPQNIRVFITSRSEGDIESCFPAVHDSAYEIHHMDDPELVIRLEDDIRLYFRKHLTADIFQRHGEELVKRAEGLFQWAAVACGYLNKRPAGYTEKDCLRGLLGQEESDKLYTYELQSTKLYKLYDEVLSGYFTSNITRPRFRSVMGHILCAFEPLSINTLWALRKFMPGNDSDLESILAVVKFMGSLLSNVTSDDLNLPVVPLHTSFRDFLTDKSNLHPFSLDLGVSHRDLTHACLNLMLDDRHGLKFNICGLESSHKRNAQVSDLQVRVEKFISTQLLYACRFWDDHLKLVDFDENLVRKIEKFFSTKFLFWLEVLSVTNTIPLAVQAMVLLSNWLQLFDESAFATRLKDLANIVSDALTFLRSFANIIATSAPHIYVSALPFAPKSSQIYKMYSACFAPTLYFKLGQLDDWPALEMFITTPSQVNCVDFSPDGEWIVSGLEDGTVCLWNATTGMMEGVPFRGHSGAVLSIAFSSDGQKIVSGSNDSTVRLWNFATGAMEGEPWVGHTSHVSAVVFTPKADYAVSGSFDSTIRLWNVGKGAVEGEPLTDHQYAIFSVAVSKDGDRVVSGSMDLTVRVWDLCVLDGVAELTPLLSLPIPNTALSVAISPDGNQIAAGCCDRAIYLWDSVTELTPATPLRGHRLTVITVNYSPDGKRLVSGSDDQHLFLWDKTSEVVEPNPLIGHTNIIRTAVFSMDGLRIASGGDDRKIGIWNAISAERQLRGDKDKIKCHDGLVNSVAYSPDRSRRLIASGSDDGTVCLWNAETGQLIGAPFRGHTAPIHAIAFSTDGRRIVSGSADQTLRVWSVDEGTMVGSPFTGHTFMIYAVAFSVDGKTIVSGSRDGEVRIWDTETGTMMGNLPYRSALVWSVAFSPDGQKVVSGSHDGAVWFRELGSEEQNGRRLDTSDNYGSRQKGLDTQIDESLESNSIDEENDSEDDDVDNEELDDTSFGSEDISDSDSESEWQCSVSFVTFTEGGDKIMSCSVDGTIRIWNSGTGERDGPSFTLQNSDDWMAPFALSPDGTRLAAASCYDYRIGVWNLATRAMESSYPLFGHTNLVRSLSFSPDGCQLVSCSEDSTIRVWDLNTSTMTSKELVPNTNSYAINDEGWICGEDGQLFIWIPQIHRPTLRRPDATISIIASHQTAIDFSDFLHGENWAASYRRR